jgi:hypothetical protein
MLNYLAKKRGGAQEKETIRLKLKRLEGTKGKNPLEKNAMKMKEENKAFGKGRQGE